MKINEGIVFSHIEFESEEERRLVEEALQFETDGDEPSSMLSEDNKILTGLSRYLQSKLEGCKFDITSVLESVTDVELCPPDLFKGIELRDYQTMTVDAAIAKERGVINIAAGGGKTEISAAIIELCSVKTIFLAHGNGLVDQAYKRFVKRGVSSKIGKLHAFAYPPSDTTLLFATIQSLTSKLKKGDKFLTKYIEDCQMVFIDEAHHASSESYMAVMTKLENARYRFLLSASPWKTRERDSYRDFAVMGISGPEIIVIPSEWLVSQGYLTPVDVYIIPIEKCVNKKRQFQNNSDWHQVYSCGVVTNEYLTSTACRYANDYFNAGRQILIGVKQIEHGRIIIQHLFEKYNLRVPFSSGGNQVTYFDGKGFICSNSSVDALTQQLCDDGPFILVGSSIYEEGVDIPSLDTVINLMQGKSLTTAVQFPGRGSRVSEDKTRSIYIDFMCTYSYVLKAQCNDRIKTYHTLYNSITVVN